jgi:hypothetical protein
MSYSLIMTNANIITSKTGNNVSLNDSRVKSVVWSDGAAMILAKTSAARDELVSYYRAWGLNVDTCDRKGLTVWA